MSGPEDLIWLITSKCNLNCHHCYASLYRFESDLSYDDVIKILDDAREAGVEHINFTGGEPTLRSDIFEILRYSIDVDISPSLFTNATTINDDVASKLSKLEVYVLTSMDGHYRELYEKIRGLNTWEKFISGVKRLLASGVDIQVNISVNKLNYGFVDRILEEALKLGFKRFSMIPTMPSGTAYISSLHVDGKEFYEAIKLIESKAEELGVNVGVWCAPFTGLITSSSRIRYGCCRRWRVMDLTPSGRVILCDVLNIEVSNVRVWGVRGAWKRFIENLMVQSVKNPKPIPPCDDCELWADCLGGCYARAYILFGKLNMPDPLCPKVSDMYLKSKI
ncbi:MAG: radical SAM protein [archaeon GBS-70-058]|nr:radical SAM protein [Candidatus Culexarchaeum nevadense]